MNSPRDIFLQIATWCIPVIRKSQLQGPTKLTFKCIFEQVTCSNIIRHVHMWGQQNIKRQQQKQQHNNHNFKCVVFYVRQPSYMCSFVI